MNKNRYQVIYIQNGQKLMDVIRCDDNLEVMHYLKIYRSVTEIISIKNLGKGY